MRGPIVNEFLLRGRKPNISFAFISQSYFKVSKTVTLIAIDFFAMKMSNKRELQEIASNPLFDIGLKDFSKFHKDSTKEPY